MSRGSLTRWIVATLIFAAITAFSMRVGHGRGLLLLLALLLAVALFGGSRDKS